MRRILIALIFIMAINSAYAQEKDWGTYTNLKLKGVANDKWSAYTEFQLRSLSPTDKFYYYEFKVAATYSFLEKYSFTLGTGFYNTFNEGEEYEGYSDKKEFRVWQQFIMDQKLSVVEIEHRYRTEQRFSETYDNRFRYRLNVSVPINKKEIIAKTLFASVYNELFFNDKLPHFSRNRFHMGAGYVFSNNITLQMGWIRQVDFLKETQRRKNYLFTSLSFTLKNDAPFKHSSIED